MKRTYVILLACCFAAAAFPQSSQFPPSAGGSGTVASVATSCGISGGPITTTGTITGSIAIDSQTGAGAFAIPSTDCGKLVARNQASAVSDTIAQAGGSFPSGWYVQYQCSGAGGCTITPATSTIDGAASLTLTQNQGVLIVSNGTNYFTQRGVGGASGAFNAITGGTNTTAAMVVGTGGSLGVSGSGTIAATSSG